MRESRKRYVLAAVAALITFAILAPYFFSGRAIMTENHRFRKYFSVGAYSPFKADQSQLWMSEYNFGTPRFANPLLNIYYPPDYLGFLIPEPYLSSLIWFFSIFLGIWGGFRFFGLFVKDERAAFLAGALFALSGTMYLGAIIGLTIERIPFTTWTLYFALRGVRERRLRSLIFGALLHGLHFFAGLASYLFFYLSAVIGLMILFQCLPEKRNPLSVARAAWRGMRDLAVFFVPVVVLILIQLLPLMEMMEFASHRFISPGDKNYAHSGSFMVAELAYLPFWFPGVFGTGRQFYSFINLSYIGFIPFVLAVSWFAGLPRKILIWIAILVAGIVLAAGSIDPVNSILRNPLSPLKGVRLSAMWFLAWNLLFLWAGARMLEKIMQGGTYRRLFVVALVSFAIVLLALPFFYFIHLGWIEYVPIPDYLIDVSEWNPWEAMRPVVAGTVLLGALLSARNGFLSRSIVIVILGLFSLFDVFTWVYRYSGGSQSKQTVTLVNRHWNDQVNPERIPGLDSIPKPGEARSLIFGEPNGTEKIFLFQSFLQHLEKVHPATSLPLRRGFAMAYLLGWREDRLVAAGQVMADKAKDFIVSDRLSYARMSNIRFYYSRDPIPKNLLIEHSFQERPLDTRLGMYLYEDMQAQPRATILRKFRTVEGLPAAFQRIADQPEIARTVAVLETDPPELAGIDSSFRGRDSVRVVHYGQERVEIETSLEAPGMLFLRDMHYPGWTAEADGKKATIYHVNVIGRGVFLEAGTRKVVFEFNSRTYTIGMVLTLVGLLAILTYLVYGPIMQLLKTRNSND